MCFGLMSFTKSLSELGEKIGDLFSNITALFVVEILIVFFLVYYVSKVLKDNDATKLMFFYWFALILMGFFSYASPVLNSTFYRYFLMLFSAFMLILFNVELKKSLWDVHGMNSREATETAKQSGTPVASKEMVERCITSIIKALQNMSKNNVGALVILSKGNLPKQVIESGVRLDADISTQLIEGIFFPNAPLHDGAMIIRGHKIQAAGCFLPLTQRTSYPKEFGTRHRAGIGVTEIANVISLVVSEETGIISIIKQGNVQRYADYDALSEILHDYYWQELPVSDKKNRR